MLNKHNLWRYYRPRKIRSMPDTIASNLHSVSCKSFHINILSLFCVIFNSSHASSSMRTLCFRSAQNTDRLENVSLLAIIIKTGDFAILTLLIYLFPVVLWGDCCRIGLRSPKMLIWERCSGTTEDYSSANWAPATVIAFGWNDREELIRLRIRLRFGCFCRGRSNLDELERCGGIFRFRTSLWWRNSERKRNKRKWYRLL